jgi:hypothetical protein
MKTFEERYQAWIEDRLSGQEAEAFERELDARAVPADESADSEKLGAWLRRCAAPPQLTNGEFFNHQLMARIAAEEQSVQPHRAAERQGWTLPWAHLAWAALCMILLGFALYRSPVPPAGVSAPREAGLATASLPPGAGGGAGASSPRPSAYHAEVLDVRAFDPNISATAVRMGQDDVTVVWLDGLDYLPDDYQLQ